MIDIFKHEDNWQDVKDSAMNKELKIYRGEKEE